MPAVAADVPEKPKNPAIIEITKKKSASFNMNDPNQQPLPEREYRIARYQRNGRRQFGSAPASREILAMGSLYSERCL